MGKHVFGEGKKSKPFQEKVPYDAVIDSIDEVESTKYGKPDEKEMQLKIWFEIMEEPYLKRRVSCFVTPVLYVSKKGPSKWTSILSAFFDKVAVGYKYDDQLLIGRACQVLLTQAKNSDFFNVTTVLAKKGQKLLKAEKATTEELEAVRPPADEEVATTGSDDVQGDAPLSDKDVPF